MKPESLRFASLSLMRGSSWRLKDGKEILDFRHYTMTLRDSSAIDPQPGGLYLEGPGMPWGYVASYPLLTELSEDLYQANHQPTEEAQDRAIETFMDNFVPKIKQLFEKDLMTPNLSQKRLASLKEQQAELMAGLASGHWRVLNDGQTNPWLYPQPAQGYPAPKALFFTSDKILPEDIAQQAQNPAPHFKSFSLWRFFGLG